MELSNKLVILGRLNTTSEVPRLLDFPEEWHRYFKHTRKIEEIERFSAHHLGGGKIKVRLVFRVAPRAFKEGTEKALPLARILAPSPLEAIELCPQNSVVELFF